MHRPNDTYTDEHLNRIAFPLGGIGAGMVCLTGRGNLKHPSLRHRPNLDEEPFAFAALHARRPDEEPACRIVEAAPDGREAVGPGRSGAHPEGFPKFARGVFRARFPFAALELSDPELPYLETRLTGWSPFVPGEADDSSLPCAGLEYAFRNVGEAPVEAVFSFHAENLMSFGSRRRPGGEVRAIPGGFALCERATPEAPWGEGTFNVACPHEERVSVDCRWFRGGWFDAPTVVFESIRKGETPEREAVGAENPSPGGSLYVSFRLEPGESRRIRTLLSWHVPRSDLNQVPKEFRERAEAEKKEEDASCCGGDGRGGAAQWPTHEPFYASRFPDADALAAFWAEDYERLRRASETFSETFHASTLPPEVLEAVSANLAILKSPTVLRQKNGRLWAWEGSGTKEGCCHGSCTHVWGYAQALAHLFPDLERGLRETEFFDDQDESGHQNFRASLPIEVGVSHSFHAALDGQLGGIVKVHREWRTSGDREWLERLYPRVKASLDYCQSAFDPDRTGTIVEPHHNTYDIEFWGPDGMTTSYYLAALRAAVEMGRRLCQDTADYETLLERGRRAMDETLWDGDAYVQKVVWRGLRAGDPVAFAKTGIGGGDRISEEVLELMEREGPRYQYGRGRLSDGVIGEWLAWACGLEPILDPERTRRHLRSVFESNFRPSLAKSPCPQRWHFALPDEGGLLLCAWPKGGKPLLPFPYSDEVWTGIEYQVASHLTACGYLEEGLAIVRTARRRYDGSRRNPFDEVECGHWYARALSSYALLQAYSGIRYDAVDNRLEIRPRIEGDFQCFFATAWGYGLAGARDGEPFCRMAAGELPNPEIRYEPANSRRQA